MKKVTLTTENEEYIINLYKKNLSIKEITKVTGYHNRIIAPIIRNAGYLVASRNNKDRLVNHQCFNSLNENSEYWTGFLMADGSIKYNKRVILGLQNKDLEHLKKFKLFLGSSNVITLKNDKYKGYQIGITSPKIVNDLAILGVKGPSLFRYASMPLVTSPNFWRGVIDGDGSIIFNESQPNRIRISLCGGRLLLLQFLDFCKSIYPEIQAGLCGDVRSQNFYRVTITGKRALNILYILYNNSKIYLDRKMHSVNKCIDYFSTKRPEWWDKASIGA